MPTLDHVARAADELKCPGRAVRAGAPRSRPLPTERLRAPVPVSFSSWTFSWFASCRARKEGWGCSPAHPADTGCNGALLHLAPVGRGRHEAPSAARRSSAHEPNGRTWLSRKGPGGALDGGALAAKGTQKAGWSAENHAAAPIPDQFRATRQRGSGTGAAPMTRSLRITPRPEPRKPSLGGQEDPPVVGDHVGV